MQPTGKARSWVSLPQMRSSNVHRGQIFYPDVLQLHVLIRRAAAAAAAASDAVFARTLCRSCPAGCGEVTKEWIDDAQRKCTRII